MLNKNTLGVKKVRGQSEATCKQAGVTKSFDTRKLLYQNTFNSLNDIATIVFFTIGFVTWPALGGQVTKPIILVKICYKLAIVYVIQGVKSTFDKVTSWPQQAFGCTCLLACCF